MKKIICENCGGNKFTEDKGYLVCSYCGTKYLKTSEDLVVSLPSISINEDINKLLEKCKSDPKHALRYANLILDIDSSNVQAKEIIKEKK